MQVTTSKAHSIATTADGAHRDQAIRFRAIRRRLFRHAYGADGEQGERRPDRRQRRIHGLYQPGDAGRPAGDGRDASAKFWPVATRLLGAPFSPSCGH
jgi:hypothetical protein